MGGTSLWIFDGSRSRASLNNERHMQLMNVSIACIPLNFTILVTLNQPNNIITGKNSKRTDGRDFTNILQQKSKTT